MDRENVVHDACRTGAADPPLFAQWIVLDVVVPEADPIRVISSFLSGSTLAFPISHQIEMASARAPSAAADPNTL